MNPQLTDQLQQLLTSLLANAQDAATWAAGQLPILVQEKILLGRIETAALQVLLGLAGWIVYQAFQYGVRKGWHVEENFELIPLGIVGGIAGVLTVIGFITNGHELLLVWFAPRLYIVEWLISATR